MRKIIRAKNSNLAHFEYRAWVGRKTIPACFKREIDDVCFNVVFFACMIASLKNLRGRE